MYGWLAGWMDGWMDGCIQYGKVQVGFDLLKPVDDSRMQT